MDDVAAFNADMLQVSNSHRICYEEYGNPNGLPAMYLHGGPGIGSYPRDLIHFNLDKYRVILFDQRGCGKSEPLGEIEDNTTSSLISDITMLQDALEIKKVTLVGESWGSALALLYAEEMPHRVISLVLSGTFFANRDDIDWIYSPSGAAKLLPDRWEVFTEGLSQDEMQDAIAGYDRFFQDDKLREDAVCRWNAWPPATTNNPPVRFSFSDKNSHDRHEALTSVGFHYWKNDFFIPNNKIKENIHRVHNVPIRIKHGIQDMICRPENAEWLKDNHPNCFVTYSDTGHVVGSLRELTDAAYRQAMHCTDTEPKADINVPEIG